MKKYDVLVIGELNVDLILNAIEDFPRMGAELIARDMHLTIGSSAAIFACNLSILGVSVAFLGIVGNDDFGNLILNTLVQKNVSTEFILRSEKFKTGATIALNYGNDRAMVTYPGAMEHLNRENITPEILSECRHVHISSVFLQPELLVNLEDILRSAKDSGITTSLDTQWDPKEKWDLELKKILPLVDVFFPNIRELLALTGTEDLDSAINTITDYANIIAVKMGEKGSAGFTRNKKILTPSFHNNSVVDAIGAGDSFNAGFILKFLQNAGLEECLKFGNLMGALNTTAAGGTTAFRDMVKIREVVRNKFNYKI